MATLAKVSKEILSDLSKIDKLPRFLGAALHTETLERIFVLGKNADNSALGIYSLKTIQIKKDEGHFSSNKVNLQNTETLKNSWTWFADNNSVELGFRAGTRKGDNGQSVSNTQLIPKLEKQYGDIFSLTDKEEDLIEDLTSDYINSLF